VLTALACPYPDLAKQDRSVCTMEKLMLSEILGENVRLSECRLDGASCCTFTPSTS
jgi:DeoR family transcriptional regulator, suf operon transcriptional repressor